MQFAMVDEDEIYWRRRKEDKELEWSHNSTHLISQLAQCFKVPRLSEAVVVIVAELGVRRESNRNLELTLFGSSIYVDPGISSELRSKVVETASRDGATLVEQWLVDCNVSHVVTKGTSIQRYLGYSSNLITPLWILKTAKEKCVQRLVHMSADLARQVSLMLEENNGISGR
ncbi:hypothetical protein RIF29_22684 [Crotalaria pallida]|uniref:BRCT domain-containing protein n=1 Tax=Crotalaria pallida TaxID=3830 RepID=A0AAN9F9K3_CROPI